MIDCDVVSYKGLDIRKLLDSEVLFFVRIHGKSGIFNNYYPSNFLNIFSSISDYRTISEYSVGDFHIDLNAIHLEDISFDDYQRFDSVLNINEIIQRCRALREIPFNKSVELIYKACKATENIILKNPKLRLIVSLAIDNYVMDVMKRISSLHNIESIRLIGFFVSGYYRFIDLGMGVPVREVSDSEVNKVYEGLTMKAQSYLAISKKKSVKNAIRDYMSYNYRYIFRYVFKHKIQGRLEYEYQFMPYFKGFHKLSKVNAGKYFDDISIIKDKKDKDMIFIPLHYHPEATVDYWVEDRRCADYLNSLIKLIAFFNNINVTVVFKEHPNYYLRRSLSFYKKIKSFSNTVILNPFIPTQLVFDLVSSICVYTGSAGLEGMMLNKKVYTVTENYYTFNDLPYYTEFGKEYNFFSEEKKKNIIRKILVTTLRV
jgi:hypothetical protein